MSSPLLEPDWWYVRLYRGGLDHLDTAVGRILPPLLDAAAGRGRPVVLHPVHRWKGPHILFQDPGAVPLEFRPFSGRHSGAEVALYEAEDDKYGGPVGVGLAEEVFQHSSELALWAAHLPRHPERAALGVLLLEASAAALDAHGGAGDPARFWERHLAWWTHDAGRHGGFPTARAAWSSTRHT